MDGMECLTEELDAGCDDAGSKQNGKETAVGECESCNLSFANRNSFRRHMLKQHSLTRLLKHSCCICSERLPSMKEVYSHIAQRHDIEIVVEQKVFYSADDYAKWKSDEEKRTIASFARVGGTKRLKDGLMVDRYACSRRGTYKEKTEPRKRAMKVSGSVKCGVMCPAGMKVVTEEHFGGTEISVDYCSTHIGHDMDPDKLHLQKGDRCALARKLLQGMSKDKILQDLASDPSPTNRLSLLRKKDLHNVCQSYKINKSVIFNLDAYVAKLASDGTHSPVLIYKPQHVFLNEFPEIPQEDFLLAIMNELQQAVFQAHCENVVLIDSTCVKHPYDMYLTTIFVVDNNCEGFPVALLYSSELTVDTLVAFFSSIKNRCSDVSPAVFMSDDVSMFYHAWQAVFGDVGSQFLSTWHVLRTWIYKLRSVVYDLEERKAVIRELAQMLAEPNKQAFHGLLALNIVKLKGNKMFQPFVDYFEQSFVPRVQAWAHCYCTGARIGTGVMEWWHSVIRSYENRAEAFTRLDKFPFFFVMSAVTQRILRCFTESAELWHKMDLFVVRHDAATSSYAVPEVGVVVEEDKKWRLPFSRTVYDVNETYEVQFLEHCTCNIRCEDCGACIHTFSCTCLDYCITCNMCKHIHYICQKFPHVLTMEDDPILLVDEDITVAESYCAGDGTQLAHEAVEIYLITGSEMPDEHGVELYRLTAVPQLQEVNTMSECSTDNFDEVHIMQETDDVDSAIKLNPDTIMVYEV